MGVKVFFKTMVTTIELQLYLEDGHPPNFIQADVIH
jgi:hypothetical protein